MLPSEPPKKLTPAPAKVIFDVDANTSGRFGLPAAAARPSTSTCSHEVVGQGVHRVGVVPEQPEIGCGRPHLDQPAHRSPRSNVTPVGLEYTGTHHMPLMAGSAATSSSIRSTSGPSSRIGTVIISMPRLSVIAKCRS